MSQAFIFFYTVFLCELVLLYIMSGNRQERQENRVAPSRSPPQGERLGQINVASLKIEALRAKIKKVLRTKILL